MIDHVDCDRCRTNHPADQHCEPWDYVSPRQTRYDGVEVPVTFSGIY